jgi:hypothetical protein
MSKTFFFKFGTGNPATNTGLSPTFLQFYDQNGVTLAPPAISEGLTLSGVYKFSYTPTLGIVFVIDGATTGLLTANRYVTASLDPILTIDQQVNNTTFGLSAIGNAVTLMVGGISNIIAGQSLNTLGVSNLMLSIGTTSDYFGGTAGVDPSSLFGYLKRGLEFNEGNAVYTKSTNVWSILSRGSSALLINKTLTDNTNQTTKS